MKAVMCVVVLVLPHLTPQLLMDGTNINWMGTTSSSQNAADGCGTDGVGMKPKPLRSIEMFGEGTGG